MIVALLLAAHIAEPQSYTPAEEQSLAAMLECEKRHIDSIQPDERRRRGEALIEESHQVCNREEAALRKQLRTRFDSKESERVLQLIRSTVREGMLSYIAR